MAYQSISRKNKWMNESSTDQLNTMIEDIESRIYNRDDNLDIPHQDVRHIAVDGCSSNSFLRGGHVLTLDLTFTKLKPYRLPLSVAGIYAVNVSNDNKYNFPALIRDNEITFPMEPEQDGPYHIYAVIVV